MKTISSVQNAKFMQNQELKKILCFSISNIKSEFEVITF